ncbi:hypothetical protein [Schaalia hyovaginalis]|uniref:hypothetical protein n=1 Tax=Schaalia hyovaginalis TaxID=29316 RepID=UPI0038B2813A
MWHALRRAGWSAGREQVARLVRAAGIRGVRPGRAPIITWRRKDKDGRPDHFKRTFTADAPSLAVRRHSPRAGGPPRACELRSDSSAPRSSPMPFPQDRGLIDALVREDQKLCRWKHETKRLRSPKGTSTV